MKSPRKFSINFLFFILLIFFLISSFPSGQITKEKASFSGDKTTVARSIGMLTTINIFKTSIPPLNIDSNADLAFWADYYGWPGNGTRGNPFIMNNFSIDGNGNQSCLTLNNCSLYLNIANCDFFGVTEPHDIDNDPGYQHYHKSACIKLITTVNVRMENCTLVNSLRNGLYFHNSNNNSFINCTISNNVKIGIYLYSGSSNSFTNCNILKNGEYGIWFFLNSIMDNAFFQCSFRENGWEGIALDGTNNTFSQCQFIKNGDYGIYVSGSRNMINNCTFSQNQNAGLILVPGALNSIINNTFTNGSGLRVSISDSRFPSSSDTVEGNFLDGRPIVYFQYLSYQSISDADLPSDVTQVIILKCDNLKLTDLNLTEGTGGVVLGYCTNVQINQSFFSYNMLYGLRISVCQNIGVNNSQFTENFGYGVYVSDSSGIVIESNFFSKNQKVGLCHDGSPITIRNNQFQDDGMFFPHVAPETILTNNIVNDKPLLYLREQSNLTFDATDKVGQVVLLLCENLRFQNMTFSKAGVPFIIIASSRIEILGCSFEDNYYGIYSKGGMAGTWNYFYETRNQDITIENCSFTDSRVHAIYCFHTFNSAVINSVIENTNMKGSIENSGALYFVKSYYNKIFGCNLSNIVGIGMTFLIEAFYNSIENCTIQNCSYYGIVIDSHARYNSVMFTNFLHNGGGSNQVAVVHSTNIFLHNYWSDGYNQDLNGDGIVDQPYLIYSGLWNISDPEPLIKPTTFTYPTKTPDSDGSMPTTILSSFSSTTDQITSDNSLKSTSTSISGMTVLFTFVALIRMIIIQKRKKFLK